MITGKLNYFSDNDNDMLSYGEYDEMGDELKGISVGVDYKKQSNVECIKRCD